MQLYRLLQKVSCALCRPSPPPHLWIRGRCAPAHTELEEQAAACDTSITSLLLGTPQFDSVYKEQEMEVRTSAVSNLSPLVVFARVAT